MYHNMVSTDRFTGCSVCGKTFSLTEALSLTTDGCPGVAIPGMKNTRWYGVQFLFLPTKNVIIDDLTSKCGCGAYKLGHRLGNPFHSSWCPWSKK